MKRLATSVGAVGTIALLAAVALRGAATPDGLGVDLTLVAVGVAGLTLVGLTLCAPLASPFLRVFAAIFAGEYVLSGLAYILARISWWPSFLDDVTPPVSLPITLAVFGDLVYLVAVFPVIRQVLRHADPYFAADEVRAARLLGSISERRLAAALTMTLVVINQLQVAINVRLSFFNRDLFNAIQNKDSAAFWSLLIGVFCFWASIHVVSNLIEFYLESVLKIGWRRWMTERYYGIWLDEGSMYRATLVGDATDNPDQRIAEDVRNFINSTFAYSISLLSTLSSLVSFSIILWTIPADFTIPGTSISVPGLPFWIALGVSVFGTWLTHLIGKPLVRLDFQRQRFEADFRFTLARVREYGEQVALLHGETAEKTILQRRFGAIVANFYSIVARTLKLQTFTSAFFQANVVIPYLVVAPYFFLGKITLGQMTQTAQAFGRVESALSFFISRYQSLASYKAEVERLSTFRSAIEQVRAQAATPPRIEHNGHSGHDLVLRGLTLSLPTGRAIVRVEALVFEAGTATLITGPSGSGKSTLFRAIAGIWPYGSGTIEHPRGCRAMLLPQKPYIPSGSLKTAVTYPSVAELYSDEDVRWALAQAELAPLAGEIAKEDLWGQRLSGGEQQRLAIARAMLVQPEWLFLDETTSALDEAMQTAIYRMLSAELPQTTIVSIGHRATLLALHRRHILMQPNPDGVFVPVVPVAAC